MYRLCLSVLSFATALTSCSNDLANPRNRANAEALWNAVDLKTANETSYSRMLTEDNTYARAYYWRGQVRSESLNYDLALSDLKNAVKYAEDAVEKKFYTKELALMSENVRHAKALDKIHDEL